MGKFIHRSYYWKMEKKKLIEPKEYIGIPFLGKIVLKISKIYDGSCVSLICEAKEVSIEEVYVPPSIFDEYSDVEDEYSDED